jgi:hypothetical protein
MMNLSHRRIDEAKVREIEAVLADPWPTSRPIEGTLRNARPITIQGQPALVADIVVADLGVATLFAYGVAVGRISHLFQDGQRIAARVRHSTNPAVLSMIALDYDAGIAMPQPQGRISQPRLERAAA